jgi:hypothetical protein
MIQVNPLILYKSNLDCLSNNNNNKNNMAERESTITWVLGILASYSTAYGVYALTSESEVGKQHDEKELIRERNGKKFWTTFAVTNIAVFATSVLALSKRWIFGKGQ